MRYVALWLLLAVAVCIQLAFVFRAAVGQHGGDAFSKPPRRLCVQSAKGGKQIGSWRDCADGQGSECTRAEPCTPCSAGGCVPCEADAAAYAAGTARTGQCYFLEGVGPYCRDPATGDVAPCTTCCS